MGNGKVKVSSLIGLYLELRAMRLESEALYCDLNSVPDYLCDFGRVTLLTGPHDYKEIIQFFLD